MNLKEIKEMIALMNENNLMELEIEKEGMRIRLKKESSAPERTSDPSSTKAMPHYSLTQEATQTQAQAVMEETKKNLVEIKAPMVGTFYRTPAPEAPPFVENGQAIDKGQVVCIIEAMKLMNEVKSEVRGKIVEVLAENGHPIEFGQPLFLVELT